MKRVIKFRVWIPSLEGGGRFEYPVDISLYNSDDLQQFTGLLDKNGKEIFEGDILYNQAESEYAPVKWLAPRFHAINPRGVIRDLLGYPGCKVTGNIHENPELLK